MVTVLFSQFYRFKDQKYFKNWTKETVFVYIFGFIFYGVSHDWETPFKDWFKHSHKNNKYMI